MSVLFLDIDGVLNDHAYDERAESTTLLRPCVDRLNRVLDETGCVVVVSSAWRYMVLGRAMSLHGFEYLLRTHGVRCSGRLVGTTGRDRDTTDKTERGRQVGAWLAAYGCPEEPWAVVDDLPVRLDEGHALEAERETSAELRCKACGADVIRARALSSPEAAEALPPLGPSLATR
jgi:hypothetical protein